MASRNDPTSFREFDYVVEPSEDPSDKNVVKSVLFPCSASVYRHSSSLGDAPPRRPSVIKSIFHQATPEEIEDLCQHHSFVYMMLHPKSRTFAAEVFKKFISLVILLDLLAFILSTEATLHDANMVWFQIFEGITSTIFLVEYVARIVTVTENSRYAQHGPVFGRLAWMVKFRAIIDLLATAPFFIQLVTGWAAPHLSYLRVFRVLRILRTDGYVRAFGACYRVIYYNREILWVAVLVCLFLVVFSSVLLYYLRPRNNNNNNNDFEATNFQSIPATMYLSVLMLTGQDSWIHESEHMPWYTKVMVGITGGLSVAMFAIPVSLLTWGFEAEAERCAKKARKEFKKQKSFAESVISEQQQAQPPIIQVTSTNSDEEYQRIIAKESNLSDSGGGGVALDAQIIRKEHLKDLVEDYLQGDHDSQKYNALTGFLTHPPQRGDVSFVATSEQDTVARDLHMLQQRVHHLESTVGRMDSKLDMICSILHQQQHQQQQRKRPHFEFT